ncbi:MAG TPA: hypothetical protein VN636_06695 [Acidimicrobiia bacterium]|nr:hypothetical protein [Acidimicrobiia bacterium]
MVHLHELHEQDVHHIGDASFHTRCLCRFEDGEVFAYVERGFEFVRTSDHEVWARDFDGTLVSARSGLPLARREGKVYYAADTGEPLYYERAS